MLVRMQTRGNSLALLTVMQTGTVTLENKACRFLKMLKIELFYGLEILLLGLFKQYKNANLNGYRHPNV